jgi:hypothetical protein
VLVFDPTIETPIPLAQVPRIKWLPKRPHLATIHRWVLKGIRGVRLEVLRVGGTLCTSEARLVAFFEKLTSTDHSDARPVTTGAARRQQCRVDAELDAAGIR